QGSEWASISPNCPRPLEVEFKCRWDHVEIIASNLLTYFQDSPDFEWKIIGSVEIENEFIGGFRGRKYDTHVFLKRQVCEEVK
ncbi:hypothetical protein LCGC14_3073060, partial [marine sediment metagenome]